MKQLIILIPLLMTLFSCSPMVHEMEDKQAYDDIKAEYDMESQFKSDTQYAELDEKFEAFVNDYPWSSYLDNVYYYWGRLHQERAEKRKGDLKIDSYRHSMKIFEKINNKNGFWDEALYRIAESLDELHQNGDDVELDEVIAAYEYACEVAPQSKNGAKSKERIKELKK